MKKARLIVQLCACAMVIALGVFTLRPEAPAGAEPVASAKFGPVGMLKEGQTAPPYIPLIGAAVGYDSKVTDVRVLNSSATTPATVLFEIYDSDGAPAVFAQAGTVAARGGKSYNASFIPLPAAFSGGTLLSSTEPLLSIVNIGGTHSMMGYTGATAGSTDVFLPAVFRNAWGWTTNFSVQNVSATSADVTMTYYNLSGGVVYSTPDSIPSLVSHIYDQGAMTTQLGSFFAGSVRIVSTQPVVAEVNQESPTVSDFAAYSGFPTSSASTTVYCPSVLKNAWGWYSDIRVQNITDTATPIHVYFYNEAGALVHRIDDSVPPYSARGYNEMYIPELRATFAGTAKIMSDAQPVVAIVNEIHETGAYLSYEGVSDSTATRLIYAPSVLKNAWGWVTDIRVQNTGAGEIPVTVKFYNFQGALTHMATATIPDNSVKGFNEMYIPQLPEGWEGWAEITTGGANSIVAIVNEMHTSGKGIAYTGINR